MATSDLLDMYIAIPQLTRTPLRAYISNKLLHGAHIMQLLLNYYSYLATQNLCTLQGCVLEFMMLVLPYNNTNYYTMAFYSQNVVCIIIYSQYIVTYLR